MIIVNKINNWGNLISFHSEFKITKIVLIFKKNLKIFKQAEAFYYQDGLLKGEYSINIGAPGLRAINKICNFAAKWRV